MHLSWPVLSRVAGIVLIMAGTGFGLLISFPGYFTGVCGFCATYPLYDVVVGSLLTPVHAGLAVAAFLGGVITLALTDYSRVRLLLTWSAYLAGLTLVFLTGFLAGYSMRDELVPELAPAIAFLGSSLLAVSIPLAVLWKRRPFSAFIAAGSAMIAIAAYPPVVNRIPFHPNAANMFQATMELSIVGHPLVAAVLAIFAALVALGTPSRLVTGLAVAPLLALAYASYRLAEIISASNRWADPADIVMEAGLYLIVGAAVAGALMLLTVAAFTVSSRNT